MYIQQLYTPCLSEAAYYIESNGEAAVIDPLRDIQVYLKLAADRGAVIKYIFETHFHADFVSGHLDLAKATKAPIVYGPQTQAGFSFYKAADGERFNIGKLQLQALHTPGHTIESTCYLLLDEQQQPHAVFTGDTLFVGDVGRPDLAQGDLNTTTEELAGQLYDSIQAKLMPLPDNVLVYPAHGPGSSCGKQLGPETSSTLGQQKQTNYALKADSKEAFVAAVTEGLGEPPVYFAINAAINKKGYESIDAILQRGLQPLSVAGLKAAVAETNAIVLDTRPATTFSVAFIPGSISMGLEGRFAEWAGALLPYDKNIVLITTPGQEEETVTRLARVGFTQVVGYLEGGFEAWQAAKEPVDMLIDIEADELAMDIPFDPQLVVIDVRRENEFQDGHVKNALNLPLHTLVDPATMVDFDENQNLYVHCAAGYRSVIAASLLKRQGIHNLRNVLGGWKAIQAESKIPTEKESK